MVLLLLSLFSEVVHTFKKNPSYIFQIFFVLFLIAEVYLRSIQFIYEVNYYSVWIRIDFFFFYVSLGDFGVLFAGSPCALDEEAGNRS